MTAETKSGSGLLETILVAVDGSEDSMQAVGDALLLAGFFEAAIRALYVVDVKILETSAFLELSVCPQVEEALSEDGQAVLQEVEDRCAELGIHCETLSRRGAIPLVICQEATPDISLIAMGRRGGHALWNTGLLGSTVEVVARKSNKPILVSSQGHTTLEHLLVPFDASHFGLRALRLGLQLARRSPLRLEVLHVRTSDDAPPSETVLTAAREMLDDCGVEVRYTTRTGSPAHLIVAQCTPATLLVMGAYGHSPLRELCLGSVTAHVMRKASGSVIFCR